jgi:hypothetical protein
MYRALTEATILFHFGFILFVVTGALIVRWRRWLAPLHLAALAWAVYAELSPGIICPLTAAENYFALHAGIATYTGDFIARYLVPVIYQNSLPQRWQELLVAAVLALNLIVYATILLRRKNPRSSKPSHPVTKAPAPATLPPASSHRRELH